MINATTVDEQEVAKFAALACDWWDRDGPLKTLHDINATRLAFIGELTTFKQKNILDVGCGGGILSEAMAGLGGIVTGIDVEATAIQTAINHADNNPNLRYECLELEYFSLNCFDIITCMEMLEHVVAPEKIMAECAKRLVSGGFLFLSTLNRSWQAYLSAVIGAEYILGILPKQTHDFKKFIKPSELARIAYDLQLDVINVKGLAYNPFSRKAELSSAIHTNYLMACVKR